MNNEQLVSIDDESMDMVAGAGLLTDVVGPVVKPVVTATVATVGAVGEFGGTVVKAGGSLVRSLFRILI